MKALFNKTIRIKITIRKNGSEKSYYRQYTTNLKYSEVEENDCQNLNFRELQLLENLIPGIRCEIVPEKMWERIVIGVHKLKPCQNIIIFATDELGLLNYKQVIITEDNFVSCQLATTYNTKKDCFYSMENLMRTLSSDEMIDYMKDHGINLCPIVH